MGELEDEERRCWLERHWRPNIQPIPRDNGPNASIGDLDVGVDLGMTVMAVGSEVSIYSATGSLRSVGLVSLKEASGLGMALSTRLAGTIS